ncbi:MAG: LLM class flavin-dependent oxidoreductase [Labilithrix sp.]|nr:LLM class flavin-dependent oxidoreductase [Labilithrix sp.]MCW5809633.1 LLM class flavin-dependent oxidoreductase [Labilithrix sp.]
MRTPLSVLDLSPVPAGASAARAVANTLDLARHAESLGLERFWLAEHHNAGALACSAPAVMIAAALAATSRVRVGAGGIMLPNHSPLHVAETFRVLGALHPGRVDLGVGRAAGTDPKTALALRQAQELLGAERFPAQLAELLDFVSREPDLGARFGPIKAAPIGVPPPPVFLLGSGPDSARLAAERGLGYAFAHHIGPDGYAAAMRLYRSSFQPSPGRAEPYAILTVAAIAAADERAADDLERAAALGWLRFGQGLRDLPLPSVAEARAYVFDADEEVLRAQGRGRSFIGEAARVADTLRAMVAEAQADELMVVSAVHDHDERKRSYERLAKALA